MVCPDRGTGNQPGALGLPFTTTALDSLMHFVKLLQTWLTANAD